MSKTPHSELDYIESVIDLQEIDPSPYQHRRHFDEDKLKELVASIQLGKFHSISISKKRSSKASKKADLLFNKFIKQVEKTLKISLILWNGNHFTLMTSHY